MNADPGALRAHREAVVRRHMERENAHDFDAATILRQLGGDAPAA